MVRIVKVEPHPTVVKEVVCRSCGATLEYVPNDVKSNSYRDIDGGYDTDHHITCPNCSKQVKVKGY
jgi:DNA-directed RNA polymerase subunit RPC12/RpoP